MLNAGADPDAPARGTTALMEEAVGIARGEANLDKIVNAVKSGEIGAKAAHSLLI